MRILITAGPTREYIDAVRFISNGSTGKMGYAIAQAAIDAGHEVTLISGPVNLIPPSKVKFISVVSCNDMYEATLAEFKNCDCVIMTAAVGDYRPAVKLGHKMAKTNGPMNLELVRTEDILAALGKAKTHQKLIGFAVQDIDGKAKAQGKLERKNLDAIILNSPASFGSDATEFAIYCDGRWEELGMVSKKDLAAKIIGFLNDSEEK